MSIPTRVRDYLREQGGKYRVRVVQGAGSFADAVEESGLEPDKVARATVMKAGRVHLMVIHPASRGVDVSALETAFKRSFEYSPRDELTEIFPNCDWRALPPLPGPYCLRAVVDPKLDRLADVYFSVGRLGKFVHTDGETFRRLVNDGWRHPVSSPLAEDGANPVSARTFVAPEITKRIERPDRLPPMPGIATEVLNLRNNPYAHVSELAAIIEQDPTLSAQIIRYASAPFYGYEGEVDSVAMAVARVLGMDFVLDLALGLSLGKSFRSPTDGPLGLNAFWRHATYTAALAQALCNQIDYPNRPSPGIAYLSGLLHNSGYLLLGHLFPRQFQRVNEAVAQAPERSILELEKEAMGMTHTELGLWLASAWDMPIEIMKAAREHHNADYQGDYAVYANLVSLANALLYRHGIGDSETGEVSAALLERVGLTFAKAEAALEAVIESRDALDFMALKMAA